MFTILYFNDDSSRCMTRVRKTNDITFEQLGDNITGDRSECKRRTVGLEKQGTFDFKVISILEHLPSSLAFSAKQEAFSNINPFMSSLSTEERS